jgi:4-amino-4-deoxy-L-arabinose transferase-like glycosyltransferase
VDAGAHRALGGWGERVHVRTLLPAVFPCLLFLYGLAWEIAAPRRTSYDEHLFLRVAHGVLGTGAPMLGPGSYFFDHTPLYTYLIAPVVALADLVGGHEVLLGRGVSAVFGLGTVILVFLTARAVRGTLAGVIAAVLVAANPYFVQFSWTIHMEVPMCFFMVLAVYLIVRRRFLRAGLAIAVAVLLKEIALGLWLVLALYVLAVAGWRKAVAVGLPNVVGFAAWVAIAWSLDATHAREVMVGRWLNSVGGKSSWDKRFSIPLRVWIETITRTVVGPLLGVALAGSSIVAVVRRRQVPPITWPLLAYCAIAIGVTFAIHLKEDRWLTGVIPIGALAVGIVVDWHAVADALRRMDGPAPVAPAASAA